jgi:putative SOS response-associated peptidase YedK
MEHMCGRYTNTITDPDILAEAFSLNNVPAEFLTARYNIAPTQPMAAVIQDREGRNQLVQMRWGLIPSWAKDASRAAQMINARAETVEEKSSFRTALSKRRCLIVADGFYEWKANPSGPKTPMYIRVRDRRVFGLAGLWERWTDPTSGEILTTCTIITTTPNALLETIHNRMPVILPRESYDLWLKPAVTNSQEVLPLLKPYPAEEMAAFPVSLRVNNARYDGPDLIEPAT